MHIARSVLIVIANNNEKLVCVCVVIGNQLDFEIRRAQEIELEKVVSRIAY